MVVHKIAIYKLMKKPTPATITSARFYASGSSVNQDSGIVFPVFCNKLHLPLLCCAGTIASIKKKKKKLIRKAESVVCCQLASLEEVGRQRMQTKLQAVIDDTSHPRHETVDRAESSFSKTD